MIRMPYVRVESGQAARSDPSPAVDAAVLGGKVFFGKNTTARQNPVTFC